MEEKKIISIVAPASGGKDYIATKIINFFDKENIEIYKFANEVRNIIIELLIEQLYKTKKIISKNLSEKEKNLIYEKYKNNKLNYKIYEKYNVRQLLIYLAESLKKYEKNIHIGFLLKDILEKKHKLILITDLRFENELEAIVNFNKNKNKKQYVINYLNQLNLPKEEEFNKIFNFIKNTEIEQIIKKNIKKAIEEIKKYQTSEIEQIIYKLPKTELTKDELIKEGIISIRRIINNKNKEEVEKQKEIYNIHNIPYGSMIEENKKDLLCFLGSSHPKNEELAYKIKKPYINYTDETQNSKKIIGKISNFINKNVQIPNKKNKKNKPKIYNK